MVLAGAATEPALRAEGLTKGYGRRPALRDVSFAVRPGEVTALVGPNGAGKTTLLALLAGVLRPDAGRVLTGGGARSVGWVPQRPALYRRLTVGENLVLFARLARVPDVPGAVARALGAVDLEARAGDAVGELSGGTQQRVNVALGLLGDPAVLLLDEPTAALDPAQRERLWDFLERLAAAGTSVVFSTHGIGEAERHADALLVLAGGLLRYAGPPGELGRALAEPRGTPDTAPLAEPRGTLGAGPLESVLLRFLARHGE